MVSQNDPLFEDIERFTDPEDSKEEKQRKINSTVNAEKYENNKKPLPSKPIQSSKYYNPALTGYIIDNDIKWGENGWVHPEGETTVMTEFQEYIISDQGIEVLLRMGSLVEVGAGQGYLTYVINENGGDCIATDKTVTYSDISEFPETEDGFKYWCEVLQLDGVEAIEKYPNRGVIMCHPSSFTRWSEDVINSMSVGSMFVYIGEWGLGTDATINFFRLLDENFELHDMFPVYDWETQNAKGYIFEKKSDWD